MGKENFVKAGKDYSNILGFDKLFFWIDKFFLKHVEQSSLNVTYIVIRNWHEV